MRRITSILLIFIFTFAVYLPLSAVEKEDAYKLVELKKDILISEHLTLEKGTFIFVEETEKNKKLINFEGNSFLVSEDSLKYLTKSEKNDLLEKVSYIDNDSIKEDKFSYQRVDELFGANGGKIKIKKNETEEDVKLPVHILNGAEVVYIGNTVFYVDETDYEQNLQRNEEAVEEEQLDEENGEAVEEEQLDEENGEAAEEEQLDEENGEAVKEEQLDEENGEAVEEEELDEENGEIEKKQKGDHNSNPKVVEKRNLKASMARSWGDYFKVTSDNATVYDIRNGKYKKVGQLFKGQEYKRVGQSGNYHKIQYGDYYAYIHTGHTEPSNGSNIPNENTKYNNSNRDFIAKNDITVYDNSSGSFKAFGIISAGTKFAIATDAGNFWRIIYGNRVGYVYKSGTKVPFQENDNYFKVTSDNATVYDIRNGKYKKVGQLIKGQEYKRVGQSSNYHKIQYGNYYAYIHTGHTEPSNGSNIANENTKYNNSNRDFIAKNDITVYDNSSGSFKAFGIISAGTKFAIATDAGNFWRIIYGNRVGYVYKSGTKNEFSNSDNYIEATSNGPVYDIRSGDYKKVAELEKGQVYRRIGQSGNYHILRLGDFRGFVHTSHTVLGNKSKITNEKENEENINDKIVLTKKTPVYDNTSGSFVKFGSLTEGVIYRIVSNGNHYAKIIFGDRIGFVNKKNFNVYGTEYTKYDISLNEAVNIQMTAGPQTDKKYDTYVSKNYIKDGKVTATTLNVRGGPGSSYWIVGQLSKGTSVDIIDEKNGWYQIDFKKRWVNASPEDVRYYLDPNNFINDEKQKFQFLDLARSSDVTASVLNNYLRGKGSLAGQGQAFIDASRVNGVNDIYLVSHAVLETGNGSSTLAQGVEYKGVTVYNMFGIGAYDSCPIECGVKRAYDEGWTTPYKAIVGGAKFIGDGYINNGQNTLYKMRWDPQAMDDNNRFGKQYATDIGWASKQVYTMYNLYQKIGSYNLYLDVPDYK